MYVEIKSYSVAIAYIGEKSKLGSVPGLDSVTELLRRLGNPQEKLRCLHIAGTNGKGSVFSFVQTALTQSGYKVGRYVSPTLFEYLERFQLSVDGEIHYMPKNRFAEIIERVSAEVGHMESEGLNSPTAFEIETAAAYLFFAEERVDFALIECGMGGRLDATNVLSKPYLSVISSISLDHMQFLGDTLEQIAEEKSGIIKKNSVCISALQEKSVETVLKSVCTEKQAELISVDKTDIRCLKMDINGTEFTYKGENYSMTMVGEYQLSNAALAIEILNYIKRREEKNDVIISDLSKAECHDCNKQLYGNKDSGIGRNIDIRRSLASTVWPGRFTIKSREPLIIIDGAHNEAAWHMLAETLKKHFSDRQFVFITGVLKDKAYDKLAEMLAPLMRHAVAITPDNARGLKKEILRELLIGNGVDCETADTAAEAYQKAYKWMDGHKDVSTGIVVCGSLSFLSEFL